MTLFAVGAQTSEVLSDIPLAEVIQPIFSQLILLFGGIAGLYLLLIFIRIIYERKKVKLLRDIRFNLDQINIDKKLPYSTSKQSWVKRVFRKKSKKKS